MIALLLALRLTAQHHADPLPGPAIIDTPGYTKGKPAVPTPLAVEPAPGLPYFRPKGQR